VFDEVVDHGPFPLASLKSFKLAPAMASVKTTLVNNDASKGLFDIAKGETPFTIDTRIAYSGDSQSAIVLNRSTTRKAMRKSPSAAVSSSSTPTAKAKHQPERRSGSGQINALNEYNQKVQLTFNNLKTDGATEMASFNERIGKQKSPWISWRLALKAKSWRC
jgi:uncharacterized protein YdgA (DUF945 family)